MNTIDFSKFEPVDFPFKDSPKGFRDASIKLTAEHLYNAYCEHCNWKSFNGTELPIWENVREDIKGHWIHVATKIEDGEL